MGALFVLVVMLIGALGVVPDGARSPGPGSGDATRTDASADVGKGRIEPMVFGIDSASASYLKSAGFPVDYGVLWVGTWNLQQGWRDVESQLRSLRAANVTPAIHLYYWGDDISPSCLANGCWSPIHGAQKDQAGWQRLARELVERLNRTMEGDRVLVLVENEFNKAEVAHHEPLDEALAKMARFLHASYPEAKVVMPLGNWNRPAWATWDRFAAESDYVGIQAMRASTKHTVDEYLEVYNDTLAAVRELRVQFHQPILIQDLALSSYPEPEFLRHQAEALSRFFEDVETLKLAGVEGLYYRSLADAREASRANYFGPAERHWGLMETRNGPEKPAARVWYEGVEAEYVPEGADAPDGPDARQGQAAPDPLLEPAPAPVDAREDRDAPLGFVLPLGALVVALVFVRALRDRR